MTEPTDFERLLASWMEADGPHDIPHGVVDGAFREARRVDQVGEVRGAAISWLPVTRVPADRLDRSTRGGHLGLLLLIVLLAALVAAGALVGSQLLRDGPALVVPPCADEFCPAGSLADARSEHSATLLPDGRVLVVGGWFDRTADHFGARASAELWGPANRSFGAAGSLKDPRSAHTATLLPDGRVLVLGGYDDVRGVRASAELWDPASGTFSPAGTLAEGRANQTATLLSDGSVLIIGGYVASGPSIASVERWNPASATFSDAAPLAHRRGDHTATLLPDGRILVIGGYDGLERPRPRPSCGIRSATPSPRQGRSASRAPTTPRRSFPMAGSS